MCQFNLPAISQTISCTREQTRATQWCFCIEHTEGTSNKWQNADMRPLPKHEETTSSNLRSTMTSVQTTMKQRFYYFMGILLFGKIRNVDTARKVGVEIELEFKYLYSHFFIKYDSFLFFVQKMSHFYTQIITRIRRKVIFNHSDTFYWLVIAAVLYQKLDMNHRHETYPKRKERSSDTHSSAQDLVKIYIMGEIILYLFDLALLRISEEGNRPYEKQLWM